MDEWMNGFLLKPGFFEIFTLLSFLSTNKQLASTTQKAIICFNKFLYLRIC